MLAIMFGPFLLQPNFINYLAFQFSDYEVYSRNALCALNLIHTLLLAIFKNKTDDFRY
jgi:hypothetical protein